jgi:predicted lipid-binding transport protein (Tim44 family)
MSRYILIRRLRGPAILLLIGILGLLYQAGVIGYFWGIFWPLLLILVGVIMLAERAALAAEGYPIFPGSPYAGANYPTATQAAPSQDAQTVATAETAIVPRRHQGFENDANGGQQ